MKAIFIKGNEKLINLPENKEKNTRFCDFLYQTLKELNIDLQFVSSNSEGTLDENVPQDTEVLMGHSKGASWITSRYTQEHFPNIKYIIVFDPLPKHAQQWNSIEVKKLLFVNTDESPYKKGEFNDFNNLIVCDDDHYFNDSFDKIKENLSKFFE